MAMAPKKKFDFFNGGRGIVLSESFNTEAPEVRIPAPEVVQQSYDYGPDCGQYPSSPVGYMPPSSPGLQQYPTDYPHPNCTHSPPGYVGQEGYPNGYNPHSPTDLGTTGSGDGAALSPFPVDDDEAKKKGKRKQRCRMCANHGIYVEVKGHKWFCPYRENHNCEKCEITRKRQYYMAEQQKLTREQQQVYQRGGGADLGVGEGGGEPMETTQYTRPPRTPKEFPRLDELVRETSNIINEDLFEMINQVVRPKTHH